MSEKREWRLYIEDMIRCAEKVLRFTSGYDQERFVDDELVYDATLQNLTLMGEAAGKIPDDVQSVNPQIPWRLVKGFRNQVVHEYHNIDDDIVWDVISRHVPKLIDELKTLNQAD